MHPPLREHGVVRATRDLVVSYARFVRFMLGEQIEPGNLQRNLVTWRPPCAKCSAQPSSVRIILYGTPDEPSNPKRYIEGGAIVRDKDGKCLNPRFACTQCGHMWGRVEGFDAK